MSTLLISDLHLQVNRPELSTLAFSLFDKIARDCDTLYILGDLFEYWIGDDCRDQIADEVATRLTALANHDVEIIVMHGNRDFLLGEQYVDSFGGTLIREDTISVKLAGTTTLLLHGDTLCTDDIRYQEFRKAVRSQSWQQEFLSKPIDERQATAIKIRNESRAQGKRAHETNIADISDTALELIISETGVNRVVHGHTHRPARHEHNTQHHPTERLVLGDWHEDHAVVAVADNSKCSLFNWDGQALTAIERLATIPANSES